jgi:hypothetical protein
MGHWQEKYESIEVGTMEVDGEVIKVYGMVAKKDRWIPNMIRDPLTNSMVYDLTDKEPSTVLDT